MNRLLENRCAIINVIGDRTITSATTAKKLEILEGQWVVIESLVKCLKPIYIVTTLFSSQNNYPVSIVRPLIQKLIEKHLSAKITDDTIIQQFKNMVEVQLKRRFFLEQDPNANNGQVLLPQIASFLDPRYKELDHELVCSRDVVRSKIKIILETTFPEMDNIEEQENYQQSALEYLYGEENDGLTNIIVQFQNYLAEPQIRFTLNPLEQWKTRGTKYPKLSELANKYLNIPATSVNSERCFSTAGNIVTAKRSTLLPDNINMLVFLYQNRNVIT